jgi:hypothetical protein
MAPAANPRLTATSAVLLVEDIVAAANHYRDVLGFAYDGFWGDPPKFVILHRDGMYLALKRANDPKDIVPLRTVSDVPWNVYFWVTDADALYAEFVGKKAKIDYVPCDQLYGCREFCILDIDGYGVGFGQLLKSSEPKPQ